jgi:hypothetical protein
MAAGARKLATASALALNNTDFFDIMLSLRFEFSTVMSDVRAHPAAAIRRNLRLAFLVPIPVLAVTWGLAGPALNEPGPIERGTDGLVMVPFSAANASGSDITCMAMLAHWYSVELGATGPGGSVEATLWAKPETGETYVLNELDARMAVEILWCGFSGRSFETRSVIPLRREAGATPEAIALACIEADGRLACQ